MMIDNAKNFKLDLTAKDNEGKTVFLCAEKFEETQVVNLIKRKKCEVLPQTDSNKIFLFSK